MKKPDLKEVVEELGKSKILELISERIPFHNIMVLGEVMPVVLKYLLKRYTAAEGQITNGQLVLDLLEMLGDLDRLCQKEKIETIIKMGEELKHEQKN